MKSLLLFSVGLLSCLPLAHAVTPPVPLTRDALRELLGRVESAVDEDAKVAVVFDLDDTLFDSRSRTLRIFRDLAADESFSRICQTEAQALGQAVTGQIAYDLKDTLAGLRIQEGACAERISADWKARFFSDAYVRLDEPVPGAAAYLRSLARAGAKIYYVTGRDEARMGQGTRGSLRDHRFPVGQSADLVMKPSKDLDDAAFKAGVFANIRAEREVIGAFENEPRNVNLMKREFPEATVVFLDTIHSSKPDVPERGIPWIRNFLESFQ